ncbi:MOSC-domain-containing protein [Patellaria atrata CBS 101060]|uniref:MOSC-domain-containing protein n=1 Tax=Patellaria atrata CBS 101060 TaxID=1346257 RepID=A0A9P4SCL7_9PEZI|nr:MOSC-domain-containing protein [Patellaria atrata CBS 101060]
MALSQQDLLVISAVALISILCISVLLKRENTIALPASTEIVQLRLYPIKSCRGIQVTSAKLLRTGLDLDRAWMFISAAERKFITIRQISKMTLIDTGLDQERDELTVRIRGTKSFFAIPAHPSEEWLNKNTILSKAIIWGEETDGYEYSSELTAPISEFLGQDVRLFRKGPTPRVLRGNGQPKLLGRTESIMFPDLAPVQVSSEKSIEELNSRLKKQGEDEITIERFRPNIVVKGHKPWTEDVWKTLEVSPVGLEKEKSTLQTITLDVLARCARCQVPNVDPDTAEKNKRQPWDTLMKYRRVDEGIKYKPCFGMLCAPREEGELRVGMKIRILEVTHKHRYVTGM